MIINPDKDRILDALRVGTVHPPPLVVWSQKRLRKLLDSSVRPSMLYTLFSRNPASISCSQVCNRLLFVGRTDSCISYRYQSFKSTTPRIPHSGSVQ